MPFLAVQAPLPPTAAPQIQSQSVILALPPTLDTLIKAKNWAGLADWFETVPPAT
jgi:hypothetical protein